jgi:arylsulfatase A-like enzyme
MWLSMDHITDQLLDEVKPSFELDRGRPEMQYDLCGTLGEIEEKMEATKASEPVFVHTRSLNLHVSKLRNRTVPRDPAYGGFQGPAAATVRRLDRCFGEFVDFLKRKGQYDNSLIVLTSDHGDSLGEGKRWGHAMTLFPEVIRIPLIVHLPSAMREQFTSDVDAVSFSTDITPTLYALLGYTPQQSSSVFGSSLVTWGGDDSGRRRSESYLLASSYGAVYGLLSDNGRILYIVDAVNRRDLKYDLSGMIPQRLGITSSERQSRRDAIRRKLDDLAVLYRFSPES